MKCYDLEALSKPETYTNDAALATLVRRVVAPSEFDRHGRGRMPLGAFKQALLRGEFPELVKPYVDVRASEAAMETEAVEAARRAITDIACPPPYRLALIDGALRLSGPFHPILHQRIRRVGGRWISGSGWSLPVGKAHRLQRILANWQKHVGATDRGTPTR